MKLPDDFWAVNEDEPGLVHMALAFAIFVMFLLVVLVYVVMLTPIAP